MRSAVVIAAALLLASCGYRKPVEHEQVMATYQSLSRQAAVTRLTEAMVAEGIPIRSANVDRGAIISDSFEVAVDYCDCGKNLLGSDYVGTRRGVMKVNVRQNHGTTVTFEFDTELTIRANGKRLICPSLGVLERKILDRTGAQIDSAKEPNDG